MQLSWMVRSLLLAALGAGCVEPVEGPPPEVAPPAYSSVEVETGFFVDVSDTYHALTLIMAGDQPSLFYVNRELFEIHYAGCPAQCDNKRFWLRGAVDTTVWALHPGGATARLDSLGTLHALFGRRFYGRCRARCEIPANWTNARIDTALSTNLALAVAPDGELHVISIILGLQYATCAGACTNSANWQRATIASSAASMEPDRGTALTRDGSGRLHVAYMTRDTQVFTLRHGTCAANCLDSLSWSFSDVTSGAHSFAFALASTGSTVDLAYASRAGGQVTHATCSNCGSSGVWQKTALGVVPNIEDVAVAAAPSGAHVVVVAGFGMSVWQCSGACETTTAWASFGLDIPPPARYSPDVEDVEVALDTLDRPLIARLGWGHVKYFQPK